MGDLLAQRCKETGREYVPIEIIQGDMLEVDWFDADIIYFSSVCFADNLVDGVMDLLAKVKNGTRIISLKTLPTRKYLQNFATMRVRMTWGLHQVSYYRKI